MTRYLEREQVKAVIYPYENHPWEKMLVLAARLQKVATLGYQHGGGIARFMLPYFHGHGEAEWAPLPDVIFTSGSYSHQLLSTGGTPRERLVMGGNLRYQGLTQMLGGVPLPANDGPMCVLVTLPIERLLAQHLVLALKRAFPDGGANDGIRFLVKPHPMCPISVESSQWPVSIATGTFQDALRACTIVVYAGTSTGLEALAMGRKAIRYRSELLLNTDRGEFLTERQVKDCGDWDTRTCVMSAVREMTESPVRDAVQADFVKEVFPPVDWEVWIRTIQRFC